MFRYRKKLVRQKPLVPLYFSLMLGTIVAGCDSQAEAPVAQAQAPMAMPVAVQTVAYENIPLTVDVVGETQSVGDIGVYARISGHIEAIRYTEGQGISKGQPMFELDPAPFELALESAKAQLAQASVLVKQTQHEEQRLKALRQQNAVSQRDYDTAKYAFESAEASLKVAEANVKKAQLDISYAKIKAPITGVAGKALKQTGDYVAPGSGQLLAKVVQLDPIRVVFGLAESEKVALNLHDAATVGATQVQLVNTEGNVAADQGLITYIAPQISTTKATLEVRAEFANSDQSWLPGQFVRVRLVSPKQRQAVLIPQTAVMQGEQGHFVYVVDSENQAAIRLVKTGDWVGERWIILDGLKSGDQVITSNLLKLRPGAPVSVAAQGGR